MFIVWLWYSITIIAASGRFGTTLEESDYYREKLEAVTNEARDEMIML